MTQTTSAPFKTRKFVIQLLGGALAGGLTSFFAFEFLEGRGFDLNDPSRMLAVAVGLIFAVVGAFVALGSAAPKVGSQMLNVEDEEELREQSGILRYGSAIYIAAGAGLIALAIGGQGDAGHLLSPAVAAAIAGICFLVACVVGYATRNSTDEMMRALGREASVLSLSVVSIGAMAWAVLAQIDRAPSLTALGVLSLLFAVQLVCTVVVVGRKGMLRPR